ncbi:MAG: hypothetical protein D6705_12625 [Deltaproteobacteria bacterium]|nr:MAG: hypothetical protein D6705_12625 [Deltaproteobacteria bacterium]
MPPTVRDRLPSLSRIVAWTALVVLGSQVLAVLLLGSAGWFARVSPDELRKGIATLLAAGGTTVVVAALVTGLRMLSAVPADVGRTLPSTLRGGLLLSPWLCAMLLDETVIERPEVAFAWALPASAALGAAGLAACLVLEAFLATRPPQPDEDTVVAQGARAPRPLATRTARAVTHAALAAALVSATFVYPRVEDPAFHEGPVWLLPFVTAVVTVLFGGLAAAGLGLSLRVELDTVATRLDALGYNATPGPAWRVVPTSFDDVGRLQSRLEALRERLVRDAAVHQRALERARDADLAKANFLGAVSHEIRTPLTTVDGFAQLLLERDLQPAQADDVRLIRTGAQQLLELVTDILDISLIESGELRLEYDQVDPVEVAAQVVEVHRALVHDKPVRMELEADADVPLVVCDRRRVRQILTNLVSNAIKFTDEGSIVVGVRVSPEGRKVQITVSDTGVGIAPDEIDQIFEEYRQVGSVKRRTKGTGLGLAIARRIAEHHGGTLTCTSVLGEGSTFTLTLPLDPGHRRTRIDMSTGERPAVRRSPETPEVFA